MPKETALGKKLVKLKPVKKFVDTSFKVHHGTLGTLELDLSLDRDNIIIVVMRKILQTNSLRCAIYGGAITAELTSDSKSRVRGLRRLRGKQ